MEKENINISISDELQKLRSRVRELEGLLAGEVTPATGSKDFSNFALQLRDSQHFIQSVVDAAPNIFYIWDLTLKRNVYCSAGTIKLLGYTPKEVLEIGDQFFYHTIHPDDLVKVAEHHKQLASLQTNETLEIDYRIKHQDGRWLTFHSWDVVYSRSEDGLPQQIAGIASDISDKKQIEDRIASRLQALTAPDISIKDLPLREIVDMNTLQQLMQHLHHITGITFAILDPNDKVIVGVGWQDICMKYHRLNKTTVQRCHESDAYIKSQMPDKGWIKYKCLNGLWDFAFPIRVSNFHKGTLFLGQFFFEDEKPDIEFFRKQANEFNFNEPDYLAALDRVPVFSHNQVNNIMNFCEQFVSLIATLGTQNLTQGKVLSERDKIQEELSNQAAFLDTLLTAIPSPVFYKDREGKYLGCNPAFEDLSGMTKEEIVGKKVHEVWPQQQAVTYRDKDIELLKNPGHQQYEYEVRKISGETLNTIFYKSTFRDASNQVAGIVGILLDITGRKKAEEALRNSEAHLRSLIRTAPIGIGTSINRIIQSTNDHLCEMLGYREEELFGMSGRILYASDEEFEAVGNAGYALVDKDGTGTVETQWQKKDGSIIHVLLSATPLDPSDHSQGVVFTALDISDRIEAAKRIHHLNTVLRAMRNVDQLITKEKDRKRLIEGICYNLVETRGYNHAWIILMNRHGEIQMTAESGLGERFKQIEEHFQQQQLPQCAQIALTNKSALVIDENSIICEECPLRDNHQLHAGMIVQLQYQNHFFGFLVVSIAKGLSSDTEEKEMFEELGNDISFALHGIAEEEAYRHEEEMRRLFERIVSTANHPMSYIDTNFVYRAVNDDYVRRFGKSREEIVGHPMSELMGGETFKRNFQPQLEQCLQGKEVQFEMQIDFPKMGKRHMMAEYYPYYAQDETIIGIIAVANDVTELKRAEHDRARLENQLLHSQKMEAIGTLAGGIAHDFNNILSAVLGYADLAYEDVAQNATAQDSIREVIKAGNRAKELVAQILAFSRQTEQERKPLRLQTIIKESSKLLRGSMPASIEIKSTIQEDCPPILANPGQMHQVIMNLGTNAFHAMRDYAESPDKSGRECILSLEFSLVTLDAEKAASYIDIQPGEYAQLLVSDTGKGMPAEILHRIFEPYFTTKEKGSGTGLGLAMVHSIVRSHGGEISVYSEEGKGTTFKVLLPVSKTSHHKEMKETSNRDQLQGNERILLVDDEESILQVGKRAMERFGYQVTCCKNGQEAIEIFTANSTAWDVVVTDLTMPRMSGLELTQHLLAIRPDLPIILCTGFSESMSQEKAHECGIRDFIMKPLLGVELVEHIRKVLE